MWWVEDALIYSPSHMEMNTASRVTLVLLQASAEMASLSVTSPCQRLDEDAGGFSTPDRVSVENSLTFTSIGTEGRVEKLRGW